VSLVKKQIVKLGRKEKSEFKNIFFAWVAKARGVKQQDLETLIVENTAYRFLGIFGEPGVNVLKLNLV
jgi:K+-transporting ATPase c subunit